MIVATHSPLLAEAADRVVTAAGDDVERIYCIVDYHALTSTHDAELIRRNTVEMALGLLALGLDPERAVLFRQSDRPEHVELQWLFASVTPMGWVERTPSFKVDPTRGTWRCYGACAEGGDQIAFVERFDGRMGGGQFALRYGDGYLGASDPRKGGRPAGANTQTP